MAKEIALLINADPEIMFEGQEKKHFWDELGGKKPYFDEKLSKGNCRTSIALKMYVAWGQSKKIHKY